MAQRTDDTQRTSTTGQASRLMELAIVTNTSMSDDLLLDSLRKSAQITTRRIRADFIEVATATRVLGYIEQHQHDFIARRGDDPAWAREIGRYATEALAIEALRMRRA